MTIYNPIARQTKLEALSGKLSDIYYGSAAGQFVVELAFFVLTAGVIAAAVAVVAA